jgi:hypothetical protein
VCNKKENDRSAVRRYAHHFQDDKKKKNTKRHHKQIRQTNKQTNKIIHLCVGRRRATLVVSEVGCGDGTRHVVVQGPLEQNNVGLVDVLTVVPCVLGVDGDRLVLWAAWVHVWWWRGLW